MDVFFAIDPESHKISIISANIEAFMQLISNNDVYLLMLVETDEQEKEVMQILESIEAFNSGLNSNKVLFCSTHEGKVHMARQLEVHLHIDTHPQVISTLRMYVPQLILVSKEAEQITLEPNVKIIGDINEAFFKKA